MTSRSQRSRSDAGSDGRWKTGSDFRIMAHGFGVIVIGRDVHETFQAETETRPRRWAFCPRRDRDRDVSATETLAETYGEKH